MAAELFDDLRPGNDGSNPSSIVNLGGTVYFSAAGSVWKTDGSVAGTQVALPRSVASLTAAGDKLFFSQRSALWVSNGTEAGTQKVSVDGTYPQILGSFGGLVYFAGGVDRTLWRSNGTVAGTFKLQGEASSTGYADVRTMIEMNGKVYFQAGETYKIKLYETGGLANDVNVIHASAGARTSMAVVNSSLYFVASSPDLGNELWVTNGTAVGTRLVKDIFVGAGSSMPDSLINYGGTLYFETKGQMWRSDGTAAGTQSLASLGVSIPSFPAQQTLAGTWLYFVANGGQLWRTNGTSSGTTLVKTFDVINEMAVVNGRIYLSATTAVTGAEIWRSSGTAASTVLLKDIAAGTAASNPSQLTNINGVLYFSADDLSHGVELWRNDGTLTGTNLVKDINTTPSSSNATPLFAAKDKLYFATNDSFTTYRTDGTVGNREAIAVELAREQPELLGDAVYFRSSTFTLYRSNGTNGSIEQVVDSFVQGFKSFKGYIYYFKSTLPNSASSALRRSNGIVDELVLDLPNLVSTVSAPNPAQMSVSGSLMYFVAYREIWVSDGSPAGTKMLKKLAPNTSADPESLTDLHGKLYFTATTLVSGVVTRSLWKTDGTEAGTQRISLPGTPAQLTAFKNTLLMTVIRDNGNTELWRTTGLAAGTYVLKDIYPGAKSSNPSQLTVVGNKVYFIANDGVHGSELWATDGTSVGTKIVRDLTPGAAGTIFPSNAMYNANGTLYFSATTLGRGQELWHTDGTVGGTVIDEIVPGAIGSKPSNFVRMGDYLYFSAEDPLHGRELWRISLKPSLSSAIATRASSTAVASLMQTPPVRIKRETSET